MRKSSSFSTWHQPTFPLLSTSTPLPTTSIPFSESSILPGHTLATLPGFSWSPHIPVTHSREGDIPEKGQVKSHSIGKAQRRGVMEVALSKLPPGLGPEGLACGPGSLEPVGIARFRAAFSFILDTLARQGQTPPSFFLLWFRWGSPGGSTTGRSHQPLGEN